MFRSCLKCLTFCTFCASFLLLAAQASQAEDGPKIISISGKAEILAAGIVSDAEPGFRLAPGQAVRLEEGGEVRISAEDGAIEIIATDGAVISYDGRVSERSMPWREQPLQRVALSDGAAQFSLGIGRVDIQVVTGQPLRLVAPLISASVRGTRFVMSVAKDGSSGLKTLRGRVETLGRSGELRLTGPGRGLALSAASYSRFLRSRGVVIPRGGSWRDVSSATLQQVDARTFGNRFEAASGETRASAAPANGDGGLDALLADSGCHPLAGRAALAGEASLPAFSLASGAGGASLLDAGPSVSDVARGDVLNKLPAGGGAMTALVTGVLHSPTVYNTVTAGDPGGHACSGAAQGKLSFAVALNSGRISNASMGMHVNAANTFSASGGSGGMTGADSFFISGFSGQGNLILGGIDRQGINAASAFLGGTVSPDFNSVGNTVHGAYNGVNSGFQVSGNAHPLGGETTLRGNMDGQVTKVQ
jgi:hypothetical protein